MLYKAVRDAKGKIRLAKLDTDKEGDLAGGLGVTGLPTVFAVHKGKMLKNFVGLLPQEQFDAFVGDLLKAGAAAPKA